MARFLSAALAVGAGAVDLLDVVADMVDGDQKLVVVIKNEVVVTPFPNDGKWSVEAELSDVKTAFLDFNVTGKTDYPPVPLLMTLWNTVSPGTGLVRDLFEFTDPSGTLGDPEQPLNQWVEFGDLNEAERPACPESLDGVFLDIHDGDEKALELHDGILKIRPYSNEETWAVEAAFDGDFCSASVDFNVNGKPNPPPVPLLLSLWEATSNGQVKTLVEFTDPSGTLAFPDMPLNHWAPWRKDLIV